MDTTLIIGLTGMTLVLLAFLLNVSKVLNAQDRRYLFLNIIGSIILIWYAILLGSVPFIVLNAVWISAAVWGLFHG